MGAYVESDLAAECGCEESSPGVRVTRQETEGCEILRVQIKEREAAERIGKPCGRYVTLTCGAIHRLSGEVRTATCRALAVELREMAERLTARRVDGRFSLLVVGLGNADMTPDAVGPLTVRHLTVTRHLRGETEMEFPVGGLCEISALATGVLGQTGLETAELVRGAVRAVRPDLVIAVDALSAGETGRLATTVQLSDTGIQPGSGVGRGRKALNAETVGVPVLSLGVPTVVNSTTLISDAVWRVNGKREHPEAASTPAAHGGFFVAPREIDLLVTSAGILLAEAIEKAFSI